MSESQKGIGVNKGFGDGEELMVRLLKVEGVESVDWASPACLHDIYIGIAATADLETLIPVIAAIVGVDQAYTV